MRIPVHILQSTLASSNLPFTAGQLFERVVAVLAQGYHDVAFRTKVLPAVASGFRKRAQAAISAEEERHIVWDMLSTMPNSHLALISGSTRDMLQKEVLGIPQPTLGLQVIRINGRYYASMVLTGGPCATAGIRAWDELTTIDDVPPALSTRLDWRSDDAHLSDDRDPPMHSIMVREGESVRLGIARAPHDTREIVVVAREYSGLMGAKASVRLITEGRHSIGYLRLWYLHATGVPDLVNEALDYTLHGAAGLILDLRGRGGSAPVVAQLLRLLESGPDQRFDGPVVALIDRQARSGKEVLAYELRARGVARLVGEPTAGAVIPASFAEVDDNAVLMFPPMTLPPYTERLELQSTHPDVSVSWGGPYSGDSDPILVAGIQEIIRMIDAGGSGRIIDRASAPPTQSARAEAIHMPTLDALLQSMTEAYGGIEVMERLSAISARGTVRIIDTPVEGTYELTATAHGDMAACMAFGSTVRVRQSVDSGGVWVHPQGSTVRQRAESPDADAIRVQALIALPLQLKSAFPNVIVSGVETFDDVPCIRIALNGALASSVVLLIDASTFLLRGMRFQTRSPLGVLDATVYCRRFTHVSGTPIANLIVQEVAGQQTEIRIDDIIVTQTTTWPELPQSAPNTPIGSMALISCENCNDIT